MPTFIGLVTDTSSDRTPQNLIEIGKSAPGFNLPDQNGVNQKLGDLSGKWLLLFFYPKDDTPG